MPNDQGQPRQIHDYALGENETINDRLKSEEGKSPLHLTEGLEHHDRAATERRLGESTRVAGMQEKALLRNQQIDHLVQQKGMTVTEAEIFLEKKELANKQKPARDGEDTSSTERPEPPELRRNLND